ncbi:MAG: anaerobic dehydrogenase [Chelatococcus sp.]|nr:anaerobic dehydrogenase [Chelatococcus sp.]
MPKRRLAQHEVERLWGQDRANLVECGEGKAALRDFYRDRDSRLSPKAS